MAKAGKFILAVTAMIAGYQVYRLMKATEATAAVAVLPPAPSAKPFTLPSFKATAAPRPGDVDRHGQHTGATSLPLQITPPSLYDNLVQAVAVPAESFADTLGDFWAGLPDFSFVGNAVAAPAPVERYALEPTLSERLAPVAPTPTARPVPDPSDENVDVLARTIYGEARSESRAGKEAVANVVMNRVASRRYPNNAKAVCLQRLQFSAWNANDPNRVIMLNITTDNRVFRECIEIAQKAVAGLLPDRTGGALHYFGDYIDLPSWARGPEVRTSAHIGRHIFVVGVA